MKGQKPKGVGKIRSTVMTKDILKKTTTTNNNNNWKVSIYVHVYIS